MEKTTHLGKGGSDSCRFTAARCSNWYEASRLHWFPAVSRSRMLEQTTPSFLACRC